MQWMSLTNPTCLTVASAAAAEAESRKKEEKKKKASLKKAKKEAAEKEAEEATSAPEAEAEVYPTGLNPPKPSEFVSSPFDKPKEIKKGSVKKMAKVAIKEIKGVIVVICPSYQFCPTYLICLHAAKNPSRKWIHFFFVPKLIEKWQLLVIKAHNHMHEKMYT